MNPIENSIQASPAAHKYNARNNAAPAMRISPISRITTLSDEPRCHLLGRDFISIAYILTVILFLTLRWCRMDEKNNLSIVKRLAEKLNGTIVKKGKSLKVLTNSQEEREKIENELMKKGVDIFNDVLVLTVDEWFGA